MLIHMSTAKSMRNVEVVTSMYESFADGEIEAVVALWNEDIELHEPAGIGVGGIYRGQEAVIDLLTTIAGMHEEMAVTPDRYINAGETVVALGTGSGTAANTGKSLAFPFAHVFDFEDGKISRWTSYIDTALFNAAHEA